MRRVRFGDDLEPAAVLTARVREQASEGGIRMRSQFGFMILMMLRGTRNGSRRVSHANYGAHYHRISI